MQPKGSPIYGPIKSVLLHFCSLVLAWNHTSSILKHTVKGSPIHLPKKQMVVWWGSFSHDWPNWKSLTAPPISTPNSASHRWWNPGPTCSQSCPRHTAGMWALSPEQPCYFTSQLSIQKVKFQRKVWTRSCFNNQRFMLIHAFRLASEHI